MPDQDPLDQLHHFDPGVPMSPLPPAEVRRRGDRRRRRTTALTVVAAAVVVAVVATPIAVLAHGPHPDLQPAGPTATDPSSGALSEADLLTAEEIPSRERLTSWAELAPDGAPVLLCQPGDASDLGAAGSVSRSFGASIAPTPDLPQGGEGIASRVRTTVLQFGGADAASTAYSQVETWIETCSDPGAMDPKRMSREGRAHPIDVGEGRAEYQTWIYPADDVCSDCDAARFDRMGVAQVGDRLVLVSLAEVGGPLEPKGLDAGMDALMSAAVDRARPGD